MKIIIEESSTTGNLTHSNIHSLFTRYFVNTSNMLNGDSLPLPFCRNSYFVKNYVFTYTAFELFKKN